MTPTIENTTHHFAVSGLFNGLFVMRDRETGTLWNHITGEAMHGDLQGAQLPLSAQLQVTAGQALEMDPTMRVAISERPYSLERGTRYTKEDAELMPVFERTLGEEDTRLPRMEMGLGIWTESVRRYYPMPVLRRHDSAVMDDIDGRPVLVYLDPITSVPAAVFVDAPDPILDGGEVALGDGRTLRAGRLLGSDGTELSLERPNQVFTRWYGFSLTFPEPEIYP